MNPVTFSTSTSQTILTFLCQNPQQSFYSGEIADETSLSKGGTNQSLHELAHQGVLKTEKKGRMIFYSADVKSPLIRQYKVLQNIASLQDIVKKIKPLAERVVLFGSCARGEDTQESDIDLLVVSRDKAPIRPVVPERKAKRRIQLLVKTPQEYIQLEKKEPVFFKEVEQGVVLWQKE
jgi:predicted nucleotidyltransferase